MDNLSESKVLSEVKKSLSIIHYPFSIGSIFADE